MKGSNFFFLFIVIILQAGCSTSNNHSRKNVSEEVWQTFVGMWEGEHLDHQGKLVRTWLQNRNENGTYSILFFRQTEKGMLRSVHKGKWWIKGNRFYEVELDGKADPDVYDFEILSKDRIHFKSPVKDYEFIDERVKSFKKPIFL